MKVLVLALLALVVAYHAMHRHHIPRSGNPQRTAEEAAQWAAWFDVHRDGGGV